MAECESEATKRCSDDTTETTLQQIDMVLTVLLKKATGDTAASSSSSLWLEFASHLLCSRESLPVVPYNNLLGGDATKVFSTIGKDVKIKHFHTYVTNI